MVGRVLRVVCQLGRKLQCELCCSVGVCDGGGNTELVPADAFAVDRVFEAVFIMVEAS